METLEPSCLQWLILNPDLASAIGTTAAAFIALLALFVAVSKKGISRFFLQPRFKFLFHENQIYIRSTTYEERNRDGTIRYRYPGTNYLFQVYNWGLSTAKNARAFIEKLDITEKTTNNPEVIWHHPTQLHWSGTATYPGQDIYSKTHHFLDLFIILKGIPQPGIVDEQSGRLLVTGPHCIKFWVDSELRGLPLFYDTEGKYECYFYVVADNAKRKRFIATFDFENGSIPNGITIRKRFNPFSRFN